MILDPALYAVDRRVDSVTQGDTVPVRSPDPTLRHALKHVSRLYQSELRFRMQKYGVSDAAYVTMFVLRRIPNLSSADLARWTGVTAQGGNQILKGLISDGLVERHHSPVHGRILEARLTERGERAIIECEREADELEKQMCSTMADDESEVLENLLRKCADGLGFPISDAVAPAPRWHQLSGNGNHGDIRE